MAFSDEDSTRFARSSIITTEVSNVVRCHIFYDTPTLSSIELFTNIPESTLTSVGTGS